MINQPNQTIMPSKILYTMVRVSDLDRSIEFYREALGMKEVRRETFTKGEFTLVFMGYDGDKSNATIELTYNWGNDCYTHGTGYGHIALSVSDIYATCKHLESIGANILRAPGEMAFAVDETGDKEVIAFIEDPDGYRIELIEHAT